MKTHIYKWGNGLAIRIAKPLAEEASLRENSAVDVTVRSGDLVVVAIEEPALSFRGSRREDHTVQPLRG
jgi:antitoxin component of MazEF toxin-antitoxin module